MIRQTVLIAASCATMLLTQLVAVPLGWTFGTSVLDPPRPLVALPEPKMSVAQKKVKNVTRLLQIITHSSLLGVSVRASARS